MKVSKTPIAAAVTITLLGVAMAAQAQQAEPAKKEGNQLDQVVITGIRASLQSAANIKRNANAVVDAVTAEDVGKLPDSDVGESLGRLPGITVGRAFGQGAEKGSRVPGCSERLRSLPTGGCRQCWRTTEDRSGLPPDGGRHARTRTGKDVVPQRQQHHPHELRAGGGVQAR